MATIDIDDVLKAEEHRQKAVSLSPASEHNKNRPAVPKPEPFDPSESAPRLQEAIAAHGPLVIDRALQAWDARLRGESICDVAHSMSLSIEGARALIKEAHDAIREDLKEHLETNRAIDLARIDHLIKAYYPAATNGDDKAATLMLKCLQHRSRLTGTEPQPVAPESRNPQNVLVWIQNQLPSINRIVDQLPVELPASAPG